MAKDLQDNSGTEGSHQSHQSHRKNLKLSQENRNTFHVELFCSDNNETQLKTILFPEDRPQPVTVADIKTKIERQFNIPACVQSLSYEAHPISDETTLQRARIRTGDSFRVVYSSAGDCEEIWDVVQWFQLVKQFLLKEDPTVSNNRLGHEFDYVLSCGINDELVENLAFKYLYPWLDARKYANKLFFVSCGGLKTMMGIYVALLKHPWKDCLLKIQCLEYGILRVLWNLSETLELRRLILSHNDCLQLCIRSLLREKMVEGEDVKDASDSLSDTESGFVLVETIGAALGLLCKYVCEISCFSSGAEEWKELYNTLAL